MSYLLLALSAAFIPPRGRSATTVKVPNETYYLKKEIHSPKRIYDF